MSRRGSGRAMEILTLAVLIAGASAASAEAGQHGFADARLHVRDVGAALAETLRQLHAAAAEPQWVAWEVPAVDPRRSACCFDDRAAGGSPVACNLESRNGFSGLRENEFRSGGDLRILLRLSEGDVDRVRAYSSACPLNAAGRQVTLLQGVDPDASVRLLAGIAADERGRRRGHETVMAIAWHGGPAADRALEGFAHRDSPTRLRERAAFWLGESRGDRGLAVLRRMLTEERDGDVLEQVVFGISLSDAAGAGDLLIDTARNDERPEVRKKALFWLAQRAGDRVVETLGRAVDDDPDAEVREHAVFALSQLSGGRGVPLLIDLAQNNRHPEVRRRAMFWLGESGDPRALDLFERILAE